MFKLMTIALLSSTIALGPCMATSEMVEDRQTITTENVKRATYDDENYTITLSAYELNNYTWHNFALANEDLGLGWYDYIFTYNDEVYLLNESAQQPVFEYSYFGIYPLFDTTDLDLLNSWLGSNVPLYTFQYVNIDIEELYTFQYSLIIDLSDSIAYYGDIKQAIELDIEANAPTPTPTTSLFDSIYDYFNDKVFDSEYLNDYEMEIMGHTTSMRHYLCLTATIIFITLIVIFCVGFIVMLVKFVANMLINLGR